MMVRCPNCGNENPEDYTFCDECGARLKPQDGEAETQGTQGGPAYAAPSAPATAASEVTAPAATSTSTANCPNCGAPTVPGEAFCNECGAELVASEPAPMNEIAPAPVESYGGETDAAPAPAEAAEPAVAAAQEAPSVPAPEAPAEEPAVEAEAPAAPSLPSGPSDWATHALTELDAAQQAMARGDFTAFGQTMASLKTFLEEIARPGGAPAAASEEVGAPGAAAMAAPGEPAMATPALSGSTGVARLVVISTGAEMPLPQVEEITVGREDPSSGIFPDIDLTPYGGEDGGVSRRHARLLHIGGEYFVEDLQSTNYTKLDGQRLPARVREKLEDGARLDFGRVAVIFRRS